MTSSSEKDLDETLEVDLYAGREVEGGSQPTSTEGQRQEDTRTRSVAMFLGLAF